MIQVYPPTGHVFTSDEEIAGLSAQARGGLVTVQGSPENVARLSEAVRVHGDLTSSERARRRKARKVARASRRANR